jgi:hypothetical protein
MTTKIIRTYWLRGSIGYDIGIATNSDRADAFARIGYVRITRDEMVRRLSRGPANSVLIDAVPFTGDQKVFAKNLRAKKRLDIAA